MSGDLFRPGQRVRSKVPTEQSNGPPIGTLGTVVERYTSFFYGPVWIVDFDHHPCPAGRGWMCKDDWIEPVYDGDTPVSWADCAWRPQTVKVTS